MDHKRSHVQSSPEVTFLLNLFCSLLCKPSLPTFYNLKDGHSHATIKRYFLHFSKPAIINSIILAETRLFRVFPTKLLQIQQYFCARHIIQSVTLITPTNPLSLLTMFLCTTHHTVCHINQAHYSTVLTDNISVHDILHHVSHLSNTFLWFETSLIRNIFI